MYRWMFRSAAVSTFTLIHSRCHNFSCIHDNSQVWSYCCWKVVLKVVTILLEGSDASEQRTAVIYAVTSIITMIMVHLSKTSRHISNNLFQVPHQLVDWTKNISSQFRLISICTLKDQQCLYESVSLTFRFIAELWRPSIEKLKSPLKRPPKPTQPR